MTKAIIFDLFGVLVTDALAALVSELNTTQPDIAQQVVRIVAASNAGTIPHETSREMVAELLGLTVDEYARRVRDGEVRNWPLFDCILELRKTYKTALLSNAGTKSLEVRFAPGELDKYFDTVVVSAVIGYAKPEARAYEIVAEKLGMRLDECVMIDDRELYCEGARGVGMEAILYQSVPKLIDDLAQLGLQLQQGKSVIMPA